MLRGDFDLRLVEYMADDYNKAEISKGYAGRPDVTRAMAKLPINREGEEGFKCE